jgi:hypothetical protein
MNIEQIAENVRQVLLTSSQQDFIYDLLLAYNKPKPSIARLRAVGSGSYNLSKVENQVLWKKNLFFVASQFPNLEEQIDDALEESSITRNQPRFMVATDFNRIFAFDIRSRHR